MGQTCEYCFRADESKETHEKRKALKQKKIFLSHKYDEKKQLLSSIINKQLQRTHSMPSIQIKNKITISLPDSKLQRTSSGTNIARKKGITTAIHEQPSLHSMYKSRQTVPIDDTFAHEKDKLLVIGYLKLQIRNIGFKLYNLILLYYRLDDTNVCESNFNSTTTQIQILYDQTAKLRSLALCNEITTFNYNGNTKSCTSYNYLKYLQKNLKTKMIRQLFSRFANDECLNPSQFVALLALTVILYRIKLYRVKTGIKGDKPDLNVDEITNSVEYLAMWCVRTYGENQKYKKYICFRDKQNKQQINDEYYVYKFKITRTRVMFGDIYKWVKQFIICNGQYVE